MAGLDYTKPWNSLDFIEAYEDGSLDEAEIITGFQRLIDNGIVWQLQGSYGRVAQTLINSGFCHPANHIIGTH